jgi:hypothetical protein
MTEKSVIIHPETCFGVSRHNVIIPLKVVGITDLKDGCFEYKFAVNHPKPTRYMICQQEADFDEKFVTADSPLCDKYTKIRLTLKEAKDLVTQELMTERTSAMMKINGIDKSLAKIDADIAELEAALQIQ